MSFPSDRSEVYYFLASTLAEFKYYGKLKSCNRIFFSCNSLDINLSAYLYKGKIEILTIRLAMCFDIPVACIASVKPSYLWSKRGRYWWYENLYIVTLRVRYAFQHTEMLPYYYLIFQVLFFLICLPFQLQNYCGLITFPLFF